MSKVQGKDTDLMNNLVATGIATELDSHLRDLEKNIAVAREFIKLADESYSELRHKWNLIQEEARHSNGAETNDKVASSLKKRVPRSSSHELVEKEDNAVSKTEELVGVATEITSKPEKSKSGTRREKARIQSEDSEDSSSSTSQPENVKSSKEHSFKRKKDQLRSRKN